ncbi:histidine protein kinase NIK1 [Acrasis kona]|uniref:Histidine protein kinase NIK1 n=1 Tax=Acrasis kona TaxID=1008807 RepID=A0AAW2YYV5_9EUKA
MRNPIFGIMNINEILLAEHKNFNTEENKTISLDARQVEQTKEYLDVTKTSAEQLLGATEIVLDRVEFRLIKLLDEVVDIVSSRCIKNSVELVVMCADYWDDDAVIGDRFRFRQVLVNFVDNAIKFSKVDGFVILSVEHVAHIDENTDMWRFNVQDQGIGIQEDKLSLLFQPFSQVSPSGSNFGGTGLGLTISKRIISKMNGTVSVNSEFGVGTTFSTDVPIEKSNLFSTRDCLMKVGSTHGICHECKFTILTNKENTTAMLRSIVTTWGASHVYSQYDQPDQCDVLIIDVLFDLPVVTKYNYALLLGTPNEWSRRIPDCKIEYLRKPIKYHTLFTHIKQLLQDDQVRRGHEQAAHFTPNTPKSSSPSFVGQDPAKFNILIVEDHEINRKLLLHSLRKVNDVHVDVACDGLEGYQIVVKNGIGHYDMILMDNYMPKLDGVECSKQIRQWEQENRVARHNQVFIVGLSASVDREEQLACLEYMNEFVSKPVVPTHLLNLIQERRRMKNAADD